MGAFYCAENRPMKKQWVYKKEERANTSPKFELTTFSSIFLLDISYMTYRKKGRIQLKVRSVLFAARLPFYQYKMD